MKHTEENIFRDIYTHLWLDGEKVSPRGERVMEIENFSVTFPPRIRWMNFAARKLSESYIRRELRWYLRGNPRDASIDKAASIWGLIRSADGLVNSNYGQYIFAEDMITNVVKELIEDTESRRACIMILNNQHLKQDNSKDYPCTYGMGFRIRKEKVNMSVHMRSQDVWFGMGNDIPAFSFVHEMVSAMIGLPMGTYHHVVDSLHVYQKHWNALEEVVHDSPYLGPFAVPQIQGMEEALALVGREPDLSCAFTSWLYSDHDTAGGEPYP